MSTSTAQRSTPIPLWVRGDLNAFFGLGTNVLLNVIVLTGLCVFVLHFNPGQIVYGAILPALGIEMVIGNLYYAFLAYRLARRENRATVAAMPYGPSVPHMFLVTAVIMLPTLIATHSPVLAWEAGLAWAFIVGVVVLIGVAVGPAVQKITPRAALLGAEAGIAITFIAMLPAAEMWQAPYVAMTAFGIILIGWFANVRLPGNLPIGLVAVLAATAVGWIALEGGAATVAQLHMAAFSGSFGVFGLHLPEPGNVPHLISGLHAISPLLATAIPLGVFNVTEGMNNTESAAAPATATTCATSWGRMASRPSSGPVSAAPSPPPSTSDTRAGSRAEAGSGIRCSPACSSALSACRDWSLSSSQSFRSRLWSPSCSTSR